MWDNLNIHHDKEMLEWVRSQGHGVFFTPQYSPEVNPIEYMFSALKAFLRKHMPKGAKELRACVAQGLSQVTAQHIAAYSLTAWDWALSWCA